MLGAQLFHYFTIANNAAGNLAWGKLHHQMEGDNISELSVFGKILPLNSSLSDFLKLNVQKPTCIEFWHDELENFLLIHSVSGLFVR